MTSLSGRIRAIGKNVWASQLLRFLVVGGINTTFGYSIFILYYLLSGSHDLALIISVCLGVVFNFFSIGNVVFKALPKGRFLLFCCNYGTALLVNSLMLNGLIRAGIDVLIAQFICLPVFISISYSLNAHFVFRKPKGESKKSPMAFNDTHSQ